MFQQQLHNGERDSGVIISSNNNNNNSVGGFNGSMMPVFCPSQVQQNIYPRSAAGPSSAPTSPFMYPVPISPNNTATSSSTKDRRAIVARPYGFNGGVNSRSGAASPVRSDPNRELVRKTIQRKLRLKMMRKGQLPPNPTVEELQLCGIQAIPLSPYGMQMPYYYVQNPYDGSTQAIPYMPQQQQQQQYAMYPQSPLQVPPYMSQAYVNAPRSMSSQQQQQQQHQQAINQAQQQQQYIPTLSQQAAEGDSTTTSKATLSPRTPLAEGPSQAQLQAQTITSYFENLKMEGLFTDELLQQAEAMSANLEPFLLPDRTDGLGAEANFDTYFDSEFIIN